MVLHSDLESPIEHLSVHKPMHVAAAYGYPDAHDLARVFKRRDAGLFVRPPRQSDGDRARIEGHQNGAGRRHCCLQHRHGRDRVHVSRAAACGRSRRLQFVLFGNTNSLFATFDTLGCDVSFVDATGAERFR
jgi:O-acetylhomoserine (thiol)-lyase